MFKGPLYDEKELLSFIANGDEVAFAKLFECYRNRIYSVAYKISHSTNIAEEIVQDVFLAIWLRRDHLIEIQNFNAYLLVIARHKIYKVLKRIAKHYKLASLVNDEQLLADDNTEDLLMDKEYSLLLKKAIDSLPNQQKQVYHFIKEEGLKREEAACLLHLSPETVKFHLAQAMKNIRTFCVLHLETFIGYSLLIFYKIVTTTIF